MLATLAALLPCWLASPRLAAASSQATAEAPAHLHEPSLRVVAGLAVQQVHEEETGREVTPALSFGVGYLLPAPRWRAAISLSGTWSGESKRSTVLTEEIALERALLGMRAGGSLGAAQLAAIDKGRRALFVGGTAALSLTKPLTSRLELGGALRVTQIADTRLLAAGLELRVALW